MKNKLSLFIIVLPIISLIGCTSVPFTRHKSPNIHGVIYSNHISAAGIDLYLSIKGGDKYCSKFIAKATTDDKGDFTILSIKEKMDYTPLMTYYLDEWSLCVDVAGTRKLIYSNNRYGKGSVITSVNLTCELKKINTQNTPCNVPLIKD